MAMRLAELEIGADVNEEHSYESKSFSANDELGDT
jgi:hypothetical protein